MDKEALRRQLEDMEDESEKWRAERRQLRDEIDKLETALSDNKTVPQRKRGGEKGQAIDPLILDKIQEAAEEKFGQAKEEWEAERQKLLSQINRLEGAVAEAIARASNPLRATQSVKEQFEVELNRVTKERTELEQAFLRGKTEWEQEKLKMTGEMVKLRRTAQYTGKPVPKDSAPETNPKVRDLEKQLQDNLHKWNAECERLNAQVRKLEESSRQWDTERRQLNDHAGQLQQAFMQSQAKVQNLEVASRQPDPSESHIQEMRKEKEDLQFQFKEAKAAWDAERRRLQSQVERSEQQLQRVAETRERVSNEVVDQLRLQYEQRLQEAIQQKTQLASELQSASTLLETERTRLSAAHQGSSQGLDTEVIAAEVSRVESVLTEIITIIDDPDTELSTVIRKNVEKAELDSYLKGILFALGKKE